MLLLVIILSLVVVALVIAIAVAANQAGHSKIREDALEKNTQRLSTDLSRRTQELTNANTQITTLKKDLETRIRELGQVKTQVDALAQYQGIVDAEEKAKSLLTEAMQTVEMHNAEAARIKEEAERERSALMQAAQTEAEKLQEQARQEVAANVAASRDARNTAQARAQELQAQAERTLTTAVQEAARIAARAEKRAEEIGGEAYWAAQNVDALKRAVIAMKNTIEGYGDRYLIPARSLLDELAEDFGHTQAGDRLRIAREATKALMRTGKAAECDYVEAVRKETAISFVTDAFNGKVDSILSRTKQDNYGTLGQEIRDAFTLVNRHGSAFKDARITEAYLASRLEELKWATIATELKNKEREEQRAIKEHIREEERARKEFEKAMKEAEREEELVKKAMEKARKEMEAADGEKRALYEAKFAELSARLKAAEEKNQRALSMAQQTRMGNVYVISNVGSFGENVYKIGMTRRLEPLDRIRELGDASVPFEFDVHAMIPCDDAPKMEYLLHQKFLLSQVNKVNPRKEFFRLSIADIKAVVEEMKIDVKWTLVAEAADYRETLAIEKRMTEDAEAAKAWEKQQTKAAAEIASEEVRETAEAEVR